MKQNLKFTVGLLLAFMVGIGFNNFAMSDVPANFKVAVVDVNGVVNQSKDVLALRKEQQTKMEELQKWLTNAKADVEKQKTQEGKEKLVKKYDSEFAKKREAIQKNYNDKLVAIDKSISAIIAKEATIKGYNMVLSKGVVLFGGEDITKDIQKLVK